MIFGGNMTVDDIIKAHQKLEEMRIFNEWRKNGDISEAVLICSPKVADTIRQALYETEFKDIPIFITQLAEDDKIYMSTNKEFNKSMLGMKYTTHEIYLKEEENEHR